MILFQCDYNEGCHPSIIEKLSETNMEQTVGYGMDDYCKQAADMICQKCENNALDVHFLVGGTQTNATVIDAALRSYQGVISAVSGHINVHETGAVEAMGHKVLALPSDDGKIRAEQIKQLYELHQGDSDKEHTVQPKMVYISNPTELGTIYYKEELEELAKVCHTYGLYLFMDGARLGYGLTAEGNDLTMADIARCCDVFYIGGTKVGALFGEAVVIRNKDLQKDFRYFIKQKGGMLAKGRLLGIQFSTLFENDLYFTIAQHANKLADEIRAALNRKGYSYLVENTTNQIFPIMPDEHLKILSDKYGYCYQAKIDDTHSAVRFCTSWATTEENVKRLVEDIDGLK
ncbi:MAG: low specificity L-threonine aldolase [Lachnospiraceae bacterium]|nr:low specificity L-threonine aldolase [Lachnospiraceae bacterium]